MRTARVLLGSLIAFLLIEHVTFNRYYPKAANPDSTTGNVELIMNNERKRFKPDRNQILMIGNSRMGFFPRYSDPLRTELGYTFATIANPGTSPRCWYFMLRDEDPTHDRYRAVVIPLEDYDDDSSDEVMADRYIDQRYILQELHLGDIPEFAGDFLTLEGKLGAARDIALKGYVYQADFLDFLSDRPKRLDYVRLARRSSYIWFHDYRGPDTNVAGLQIDWQHHTIEAPPGMPDSIEGRFSQGRLFAPIRPGKSEQHRLQSPVVRKDLRFVSELGNDRYFFPLAARSLSASRSAARKSLKRGAAVGLAFRRDRRRCTLFRIAGGSHDF